MKKFKELKDKQKVLAVFGILGLVLILTGVTYAFFSYTKEGSTENTIKSGSITFWYDEINQSGNSISIEDALPITDEQGKQQTQAFNFKIQSTTSNTNTIPYEITLRQKQGTDNIGNVVKVYLAKTSSVDATIASEEEVELSLFSELSNVTKNTYSEKLLHTDIVPASDTPYTQFYRLKMWLDNSADFSDGTLNDKTFTVTVNVYANGHVLDGNSGTATVNSVSVGGNELTATTVGGIDTYSAALPQGTTSTTIAVDAGDYTNVTVTKTQSDYTTPIASTGEIQRLSQTMNKRVNLTAGNNYFKIVATSEDQTDSKEIHVMIKVKKIVALQGLAKDIYDDNLALQGSIYTNPTLTTSSSLAGDRNGLYKKDTENGFGGLDDEGTTYYFRGAVTNNKVSFAGLTWRIIRINEDGTVRLILDDVITVNRATTFVYGGEYYFSSNSTAKQKTETWYDDTIGNDENYSSKIATGNYFCEAARFRSTTQNNNEPIMVALGEYVPDLECNNDSYGKGLVNLSVGLINADEVWYAGGCAGGKTNNTFYLYKDGHRWWTMSTAGWTGSERHTWVYYDNYVSRNQANAEKLRPVINLKADVTATKDANGVYVID